MVQVKPRRGPQRGVPGKRQLLGRRENAHPHALPPLRVRVTRQHKGRFGEVGLAGDRLHLRGREPASIGEDRQRIAFERSLCEDIQHGVGEPAAHAPRLSVIRPAKVLRVPQSIG